MSHASNLITDQEVAFALLVLSGTMTDRQAAEAVGLDPDSAVSTKSKPCVRLYMLEHRVTVEQQVVEQDTQEIPRFNVSRDQVLTRLWEIANMEPERTRNSMSSQVKALSMIVAIEGLIPDRRAARNQPVPPPVASQFYKAAWNRAQPAGDTQTPQAQEEEAAPEPQSAAAGANDPPPSPDQAPMELSSRPERSGVEGPAAGSPLNTPQTTSSVPRVPMADYFAPDTRVPFSIPKKFARRRL